jgi:hypothetical protein
MQTRTLDLSLDAFGAAPTPARAEIVVLSPGERLKRAGLAFGALLAVALIALPIPLVHFVLVPAALLGAVGLAVLRLRQPGTCPLCGAQQTFSVMGRFRLPKTLHCAACHRELTLAEVGPGGGRGTSPRVSNPG